MMRRREFIQLLGVLPAAGCAWRRGAAALEFRALEELAPELMARFDVPGASMACVREGQLAWGREFGVRSAATREPVQATSLFEAASVSKTVFAYAALKLCENGTMGLDAPLTRFTRARFVEGDARIDQITPRQLLSHSSGFAEWRSNDGPLIRREPGTSFEYSGEGYYYLQAAMTELKGSVDRTQCARYEADFEVCATDFDEFMKGAVLRPFGMRQSSYLATDGWEQRIAPGHDEGGQPMAKRRPRGSDVARYGAVGGLHTNAREYALFLMELVAPKGPDEHRLGEGMLREMARPQIKLPKGGEIDGCAAWGLGWGIQERAGGKLLVHSGGQSGFRSLALASMERKAGFIVLTNSDNGGRLINHPRFLELAGRVVLG